MSEEFTRVSFCSATNSTMFCGKCGAAVCRDEKKCPGCSRTVVPESYNSRWNECMRPYRIKCSRKR